MTDYEFVEIQLICKTNYFDPELNLKLCDIHNTLKEILQIDKKCVILKKIQPWNSVKITFDIPKEAVDRLHLLAMQENFHLINLGIISIEIMGQINPIVISKESSSKTDSQRIKIENDLNRHITYLNNDSYLYNNSWSEYKMNVNGIENSSSQSIEKS